MKSCWVAIAAGAFVVILGLLPKATAVVAVIPFPIIGGTSLVMFANVTAIGVQALVKVDLCDSHNAVTISALVGLAPLATLELGIVSVMPPQL